MICSYFFVKLFLDNLFVLKVLFFFSLEYSEMNHCL